MTASKHVLGSNLAKIDAHVIAPEEYEEIPELTDEWFEAADLYVDGKLVRHGRPIADHLGYATGDVTQAKPNNTTPDWAKIHTPA